MPNLDQKKENRLQEGDRIKGKEKGSVMFSCMGKKGTGREEMPESGANSEYRHVNISHVTGAMGGGERTGK